jgi:hypothetical protein
MKSLHFGTPGIIQYYCDTKWQVTAVMEAMVIPEMRRGIQEETRHWLGTHLAKKQKCVGINWRKYYEFAFISVFNFTS